MAEVLGAASASIHLVKLAAGTVKFFSDMASGFKDLDGKVALVHTDLYSFEQNARVAHQNLERVKVDDLGLTQLLSRYKSTITKLRGKMEKINHKKKLWGKTKMWMQLMKSDSEVLMLREQLRRHSGELLHKFTVTTLLQVKQDVKAIRQDVRQVSTTVHTHHEFSRNAHQSIMLGQQSIMLHQRSSEENLRRLIDSRLPVQNIQTPTAPPAHYSPPVSPTWSSSSYLTSVPSSVVSVPSTHQSWASIP